MRFECRGRWRGRDGGIIRGVARFGSARGASSTRSDAAGTPSSNQQAVARWPWLRVSPLYMSSNGTTAARTPANDDDGNDSRTPLLSNHAAGGPCPWAYSRPLYQMCRGSSAPSAGAGRGSSDGGPADLVSCCGCCGCGCGCCCGCLTSLSATRKNFAALVPRMRRRSVSVRVGAVRTKSPTSCSPSGKG